MAVEGRKSAIRDGKRDELLEGHEAWRLTMVAAARLTAEWERVASEKGLLSPVMFDLLTTLDGAPDQKVRLGDLAEAVLLTRAGLSRLVDRAEAAGLLRREPCPADRRGAFAVLTPAGSEALRRTWPTYFAFVHDRFVRQLPDPAALAKGMLSVLSANGWLPERRVVQLTISSPRRPRDTGK